MTPVLDDALLSDAAALAARDVGNALRSAATAGAQVRSTAEAAAEAGVAELAGTRPRALVLLQRPGASVAAYRLLAALLGPRCPVPIVLSDVTPVWIGPLDVVVAHTDNPEDIELADSVALATRRGADVVLSAPAEGPVASAGAGRARLVEPRIPVPPGFDLPRALAVGLTAAAALDLFDVSLDPSLDALADELDAEAERNQPAHEPFVNPAKSLALRLADHVPLIWGTDRVAAAVAAHAADALAAHARVIAHAADISHAATSPGLRQAIEKAAAEHDIFHDPFEDPVDQTTPSVRLLLVATGDEDPHQVALRRTGQQWPSVDVLHPVEEVITGTRHGALLRAALLAGRFTMAAVYLGLATHAIGPT